MLYIAKQQLKVFLVAGFFSSTHSASVCLHLPFRPSLSLSYCVCAESIFLPTIMCFEVVWLVK